VNYRIDYKSEKFKIYDLYKFGIFVLSHLAHKFHMKITVVCLKVYMTLYVVLRIYCILKSTAYSC